jgi:hypothetical protein
MTDVCYDLTTAELNDYIKSQKDVAELTGCICGSKSIERSEITETTFSNNIT